MRYPCRAIKYGVNSCLKRANVQYGREPTPINFAVRKVSSSLIVYRTAATLDRTNEGSFGKGITDFKLAHMIEWDQHLLWISGIWMQTRYTPALSKPHTSIVIPIMRLRWCCQLKIITLEEHSSPNVDNFSLEKLPHGLQSVIMSKCLCQQGIHVCHRIALRQGSEKFGCWLICHACIDKLSRLLNLTFCIYGITHLQLLPSLSLALLAAERWT